MKDVFLAFEDSKNASQESIRLFRHPIAEIRANDLLEVVPSLTAADEWRRKGYYVAGLVAYEAGYALIDKKISHRHLPQTPLVQMYVFESMSLTSFENVTELSRATVSSCYAFQESLNFTEYAEKITELKKYFFSGDSYQTNFSMRQTFNCTGTAFDLYKTLRGQQKVSYGAFLNLPQGAVLSFSPELFLKKTGDLLTTKPMKGTMPREASPIADEKNKVFLKNDEKTIAENLMIVDLLRNDMGRIAKAGSVQVEKLFEVESYETLHQMTTTIQAHVDRDVSVTQVFKALFPCGSITGAPKMRTMELIAQLENKARGIYTGSMGFISPDNDFTFNVAIRTLQQKDSNTYELGLGGGVLMDSDILSEYQECLLKGQFVKKANGQFEIFETLISTAESSKRQAHLQRLEKSCQFFGFTFDGEKLKQQLDSFLSDYQKEPHKVKLSLNVTGKGTLSAQALEPVPIRPTVIISSKKTESTDIFLQHKTSKRQLYESEWVLAKTKNHYDVLFFNEQDQLTEASRHNVFLKIKGQWFTPPVHCGLLPGVQRSQSLVHLGAQEKSLTLADLKNAEKILLTNSVRGPVEVKL